MLWRIYTSNLGFGQVVRRPGKLPSAKIDGSRSRARRGARGVENSVKGGRKQPPLFRILAFSSKRVKIVRVNPLSLVLAPLWQSTLNAKWFSVSWQGSAAFEGYKGAVPLAALPFPQPLFPPAPSSSSRLALCPPTRCRSVLAMQVTAPILPLESPAAPHPPPRPGPGTSPTTSPVGRPLSRPRG